MTPYNFTMFAVQDFVSFPQLSQQLSREAGLPVQLLASIDSSNQQLLNTARDLPLHPQAPCALMALHQSAGRGRRGRAWLAAEPTHAPAPAFLASIGVRSTLALQALSLLPLQVGVAVVEVLQQWGCPAQLKWPNDIVLLSPQGSAKLGGILLETRSLSHPTDDGLAVVIGMGLNWHAAPAIDAQPTACVLDHAPHAPAALAASAALLAAMVRAWQRCVDQTACDFAAHDALLHRPITVHGKDALGQDTVRHGTALGVNAAGHLGVQWDAGSNPATPREWLHSGEVSVRAAPLQGSDASMLISRVLA